jgi:hypothetical protein
MSSSTLVLIAFWQPENMLSFLLLVLRYLLPELPELPEYLFCSINITLSQKTSLMAPG